ncbi:MAG: FliH/SctL family protein [Armatimonadota bacterium]|nr:hypothetical protein [bacterium]
MNRLIKCGRDSDLMANPVKLQPMEVTVADDSESEPDPREIARQEAEIIVRTARAEAQSIKKKTRDEAHAEGYNAGIEESRQRVQELVEQLEADIASVEIDKEAVLSEIEPEVLKLCVDAVEKIIRHEIKIDSRIVLRVIKSCLRRVKNSSEVRVRVNPSELAAVRAKRDELLGLADGLRGISVVDDRRISAGGCVIETSSGDFDATIETQMDRIEKKIGDTYEDGSGNCP